MPSSREARSEAMAGAAIAVLRLLYPETEARKWIFPQEKATFDKAGQDISILIVLVGTPDFFGTPESRSSQRANHGFASRASC